MPKVKAQISISLDGYMARAEPERGEPARRRRRGAPRVGLQAGLLQRDARPRGRGRARRPATTVLARRRSEPRRGGDGPQHVRPGPRPLAGRGMEGLVGRRPAVPLPGLRPHPPPARPLRARRRQQLPLRHRGDREGDRRSQGGGRRPGRLGRGGASTLQQTIAAGLLDEIVVTQVPVLLGGGERLFDHLAAGAATVELTRRDRGRRRAPPHLPLQLSPTAARQSLAGSGF